MLFRGRNRGVPLHSTYSELLTPSISECPSLLGLEFLLRKRFCGFLKVKENTQKDRDSVTQKIAVKL